MNRAGTFTRRDLWIHMLLYPGHTLPTAGAPVLVAMGLGFHTETLGWAPAGAAFLAGWLIQLGGVFTDNYENLVRNPNDREHPQLVQALESGVLTLRGLKRTILACYLASALAGVYLFHVGGIAVLVIGLASVFASWIYSAGPRPVGELGLADPLFFLFFGPVSVTGSYFVQAAAVFDASGFWQGVPTANLELAFFSSLPIGALTTCILIIDDIRDRAFDLEKGKRTVSVRFGRVWSRIELTGLIVAAYLAPFFFWRTLELDPWVLLPLLTAPLAISLNRKVLVRDRFCDLVPMSPGAARLLLAYAALLALGLARSSV